MVVILHHTAPPTQYAVDAGQGPGNSKDPAHPPLSNHLLPVVLLPVDLLPRLTSSEGFKLFTFITTAATHAVTATINVHHHTSGRESCARYREYHRVRPVAASDCWCGASSSLPSADVLCELELELDLL